MNRFKNQKKEQKNKFKESQGYNKLYPIFSFKEYKETKFFSEEHANLKHNSLYNFLSGLKEFSNFTWGEIKKNPKYFNFHELTKEIPELNKLDQDILVLQFSTPRTSHARIYGYFDENNVFNILLYDAEHNIYKRN